MKSTNWPAPNVWVFIAQSVEHCSAYAEAMGSNPVESRWIPLKPRKHFSGLLRLFKSQTQLRWSHLHFICMSAVHIILITSSPCFSNNLVMTEVFFLLTFRQKNGTVSLKRLHLLDARNQSVSNAAMWLLSVLETVIALVRLIIQLPQFLVKNYRICFFNSTTWLSTTSLPG